MLCSASFRHQNPEDKEGNTRKEVWSMCGGGGGMGGGVWVGGGGGVGVLGGGGGGWARSITCMLHKIT